MALSTTYSSTTNPSLRRSYCAFPYTVFTPFYATTFTGKETDCETGFSYFGARYYDPTLLTSFLSIDRYADKYPSLSPYHYCAWNPIKLTDPTGDTIFNKYETYKDITQRVGELTKQKESVGFFKKLSINKQINNLKSLNTKYKMVQGALDAFKENNIEEYNRVDHLSYQGKSINVIVGVSDHFTSDNGELGTTQIKHYVSKETSKVEAIASPIIITLYSNAFIGNSGLSTLANEFGDAIFGIECPENQVKGAMSMSNYTQNYYNEGSSKFSFDYESYITDPQHHAKPNPHSKKYSNN